MIKESKQKEELIAGNRLSIYLGAPRASPKTCQESFTYGIGKIGAFRSESRFGAWLPRIVVNAVFIHMRHKKVARSNRSSERSLNAALPEDEERTYDMRLRFGMGH